MKFDPTKELSRKDVESLVRDIVETGTLIISSHAKERMAKRGYTIQDVQFILSHGRVQSSEFNVAANNWKYRFEGNDIDGDTGAVIIAIASHYNAIIITVLG